MFYTVQYIVSAQQTPTSSLYLAGCVGEMRRRHRSEQVLKCDDNLDDLQKKHTVMSFFSQGAQAG
jgi:outer membrane murein-binding lipoprotein Lpp